MEKRTKKVVKGTVVSDKMDKTAVVLLETSILHPRYKKYVKKTTKVKVHDELNQAKLGEVISIIQTRPLSKEKRWTIMAKESTTGTDL